MSSERTLLLKPLPDESLWSVIERTCNMFDFPRARYCARIFGSSVRPFFPTGLTKFEDCLSFNWPAEKFDVYSDLTVWPYVSAVKSPAQKRNTRRIVSQSGRNGTPREIHRLATPWQTPFRYCKFCVEEFLCGTGSAYWRRSHQLPFTFVCLEHEYPLDIHWPPHDWGRLTRFSFKNRTSIGAIGAKSITDSEMGILINAAGIDQIFLYGDNPFSQPINKIEVDDYIYTNSFYRNGKTCGEAVAEQLKERMGRFIGNANLNFVKWQIDLLLKDSIPQFQTFSLVAIMVAALDRPRDARSNSLRKGHIVCPLAHFLHPDEPLATYSSSRNGAFSASCACGISFSAVRASPTKIGFPVVTDWRSLRGSARDLVNGYLNGAVDIRPHLLPLCEGINIFEKLLSTPQNYDPVAVIQRGRAVTIRRRQTRAAAV